VDADSFPPPPERSRGKGGREQRQAREFVRHIANPCRQRLCEHFLKNDCLWGDQCRFAHSQDELRAGAPATEGMTFSNLEASLTSRSFTIPPSQLKFLMTEESRRRLVDASGVSEVRWEPDVSQVTIGGAASQVEAAGQLLKRVTTHCKWGVSEAKVRGLLSLSPCSAARIRLSPMLPSLRQVAISLTSMKPTFTIGSGATNDLVLNGTLISRSHAMFEFVPSKGALYVVDTSTNGTFLNGVPLPAKSGAKVVLWHGDELLFPEPGRKVTELEFGYMVNVDLVVAS